MKSAARSALHQTAPYEPNLTPLAPSPSSGESHSMNWSITESGHRAPDAQTPENMQADSYDQEMEHSKQASASATRRTPHVHRKQ